MKKETPELYVDDGVSTMGSRCYIHAHTLGSVKEHGKCPPSNDKSGKYTKKSGALCYIDCEKEYGKGYSNTGSSCFNGVDTKGVGSMTCKPGEEFIGGRCYVPCPEGYKLEFGGITCSKKE